MNPTPDTITAVIIISALLLAGAGVTALLNRFSKDREKATNDSLNRGLTLSDQVLLREYIDAVNDRADPLSGSRAAGLAAAGMLRRVNSFGSEAALSIARAIAVIAHAGQHYGDGPYVFHPIRVAETHLPVLLKAYLPDKQVVWGVAIAAAYLHDVLEDAPRDLKLDANLLRRAGVQPHAAQLVRIVTRDRSGKNPETYDAFIDRIIAAGILPILLKLADITDHLSQPNGKPSLTSRYVRAKDKLLAAIPGALEVSRKIDEARASGKEAA